MNELILGRTQILSQAISPPVSQNNRSTRKKSRAKAPRIRMTCLKAPLRAVQQHCGRAYALMPARAFSRYLPGRTV